MHAAFILYWWREVRPLFKVNKPEMVNKTFRMPVELVERLTKLAQEQKVSLNSLVCQCCEYALEHTKEERTEE